MTTKHELWMHVPKAAYHRIYSRGYDAAKRRFALEMCPYDDDGPGCISNPCPEHTMHCMVRKGAT